MTRSNATPVAAALTAVLCVSIVLYAQQQNCMPNSASSIAANVTNDVLRRAGDQDPISIYPTGGGGHNWSPMKCRIGPISKFPRLVHHIVAGCAGKPPAGPNSEVLLGSES